MKNLINNEIKWAIGLIEADGYIGFYHNGNKKWIITLKVSLNSYNIKTIYKLKRIIGYGSIHKSKNMVTWKITNKETIKNHILPILSQFNFRGLKYYQVMYLKDAINIMESSKNTNEKHEILSKLKLESKDCLWRVSPIVFPILNNDINNIIKYNLKKK